MISAHIFLGMIGAPQIILIVVVLLLLFGGKKIPELMRGLGSGIKEFKDASKNDDEKRLTIKPKASFKINKKPRNFAWFFYLK